MPELQNIERKMESQIVENTSTQLLLGIEKLIEQTSKDVAVYLNLKISRL